MSLEVTENSVQLLSKNKMVKYLALRKNSPSLQERAAKTTLINGCFKRFMEQVYVHYNIQI